MNDDLFLKIVSGELPSEKIYEDEKTYAFLDIKPTNDGHTLVVPKRHARNIHDISPEDWSAVMQTVRFLAPIIQKAVGADGINIIMNNERAAGQLVFHAHVHIVPRFAHDGYRHWHGTDDMKKRVGEVAEKIRRTLDAHS